MTEESEYESIGELVIEGKVRFHLYKMGKSVELSIRMSTDDPTLMFPFEKELGKHLYFDSGFLFGGADEEWPEGARDWKIPLRNKEGKRSRR